MKILQHILANIGQNSASHPFSPWELTKSTFSKILTVILTLILSASYFVLHPASASNVPDTILYTSRLSDKAGKPITTAHDIRFSMRKSADFIAYQIRESSEASESESTTETGETSEDSDATETSDISENDESTESGDITKTGEINTAAITYAGWQEVHTVTPDRDGNFSIELGSITALPDTFDALNQQYLQIEVKVSGADDTTYQLLDVNGDNGADSIDRQAIRSIPFAHQAKYANGSTEETFTIDADDTQTTGQIQLQFGTLLAQFLAYDLDLSKFILSDDLEVQGSIEVQSINGVVLDTSAITEQRTLIVSDADLTIVGEDTTQTLTNKTLDANHNTIVNLTLGDLTTVPQQAVIPAPYPGQFFTGNDAVDAYLKTDAANEYSIEMRSSEATGQNISIHTSLTKPTNFSAWDTNIASIKVKTTGIDPALSGAEVRVNSTPVTTNITTSGAWQEVLLPLAAGIWAGNDVSPINLEIVTTTSANAPVGIKDITLYYMGY